MTLNYKEKIELTVREADWLGSNFPLLRLYHPQEYNYSILKGTLQFIAIYQRDRDIFKRYRYEDTLHPTGKMLSCNYRIEAHLFRWKFQLPPVKEIGGKISQFAKSNGIPSHDMHISTKNFLCLSGRIHAIQYMKSGFKLDSFIEEFIVPFFYDQAFYEKFKKWPRGELRHNHEGEIQNILEFCPNMKNILGTAFNLEKFYEYLKYKNIKQKHLCICGSGKVFGDCHPDFIQYSKTTEYLEIKNLLYNTER